jgi:dTMP kinase
MPASLPTPAAPAQDVTRSVLSIPAFRRLWNAMVFSSLGDWLGLLATTAMAQQLSGG